MAKLGMSVLGIGQNGQGELYVMGMSGATASNIGITDLNNRSDVVRKLMPLKTKGKSN
jgi:hypothetical protein